MNRAIEKLFSLKGTTGIVTGGSSGLGLAMTRVLAAAGADVHAFSRAGKPRSGRAAKGVTHHAVDVTDAKALAAHVKRIGRESGIDFIVNNAGINVRGRFTKMDTADWARVQAVNVTACAELARLAHPFLKRSRHPGRVVFVSSMAAHLGFDEVVPYSTSKAAVLGLMRGLAVEWAKEGILVNSVAPGWFPSEMAKKVLDPKRRAKVLARMPLHRFGEPDELAAAVVFLLSPSASYITGTDLVVDGGALAFGF